VVTSYGIGSCIAAYYAAAAAAAAPTENIQPAPNTDHKTLHPTNILAHEQLHPVRALLLLLLLLQHRFVTTQHTDAASPPHLAHERFCQSAAAAADPRRGTP
jgi:hypothetical protein